MGITFKSNNFSVDMGYGGFLRFREKVAWLTGNEFGQHYEELRKADMLFGENRDAFYEEYNKKTHELIEKGFVTAEIANFCYQSDCEGAIDQRQAQFIYEKIKHYDDNIAYGYVGSSDCARFSDLKNIFKDCAENGNQISWS